MVNPWFVTGFTDGEGCFSLFVHKDKQQRKNNTASIYYRWTAIYIIGLRGDDKQTLEKIKDYFKCGYINFQAKPKETRDMHNFGKVYFSTRSLSELVNYIIPHFEKYPLQSKKNKDYLLWKEAVYILAKARENILPFQTIKYTPEQEKRLTEIHIEMRKRNTGRHIKEEYKNIDKDGNKEVVLTLQSETIAAHNISLTSHN